MLRLMLNSSVAWSVLVKSVREVFSGRRVSSLSPDEVERAYQAGYEPSGVDDWLIGRDPREMIPDELRAMGHEAMSPMAAIRLKCLDCAGSSDEVRKCVAVVCPSWPFRTGKNRWRAPPSEAQRASGRRSIARMNAVAFEAGKMPSVNAEAAALVPEQHRLLQLRSVPGSRSGPTAPLKWKRHDRRHSSQAQSWSPHEIQLCQSKGDLRRDRQRANRAPNRRNPSNPLANRVQLAGSLS
jgi:hypothetical protein